MVGLLGKGSHFFVNYNYWHRLFRFGKPKIDLSKGKGRENIEIEFTLPISNTDNKKLAIKYINGNISPTFEKDTCINIGLEMLFGAVSKLDME